MEPIQIVPVAEYRDDDILHLRQRRRYIREEVPEPQTVIAGVAVPESEKLVLAYRRLMLAAGRATNKRRKARAA